MYPSLLILSLLTICCTAVDPIIGWTGFPSDHKPVADNQRRVCTVTPRGNGADDGPGIVKAFRDCSSNGHIIMPGSLYIVQTPMNTTGLRDVKIELTGIIQWDTNTSYWLGASMPIGYQNQSTVWFLGGDMVQFIGNGTGTLDGNGQVWYDLVKGASNYPNRPHAITFWNCTNSIISDLRFINSQMWTMTIMHSSNVLLEDIYINSTSKSKQPARNTDGADTLFSDHITFTRWIVDNGDDAIALKANSTNIVITDSVFYRGQGIAVGSIGQYPGVFEIIENFYVSNVTLHKTAYAGYIKTWTGVELGSPPNGGGGGLGYMNNIVWEDLVVYDIRTSPLSITQCTSFSGHSGENCDTSQFKIKGIAWKNFTGTSAGSYIGKFDCSSGAGGCTNITIENMQLKSSAGDVLTRYTCDHVYNTTGFTC